VKKHPNHAPQAPRALGERELRMIKGGEEVMKKRHEMDMIMEINRNLK